MEPAHWPMIDTRYTSDMMIVRFLYFEVKSPPNAWMIDGFFVLFISSNLCDSLTFDMIQPTKSAGTPPNANIQRQPKFAPIV